MVLQPSQAARLGLLLQHHCTAPDAVGAGFSVLTGRVSAACGEHRLSLPQLPLQPSHLLALVRHQLGDQPPHEQRGIAPRMGTNPGDLLRMQQVDGRLSGLRLGQGKGQLHWHHC